MTQKEKRRSRKRTSNLPGAPACTESTNSFDVFSPGGGLEFAYDGEKTLVHVDFQHRVEVVGGRNRVGVNGGGALPDDFYEASFS